MMSARGFRFIILGVLMACGVQPTLTAQEIYSWEECLAKAKSGNLELRSAAAELQQAKEDLTIAYSNWYPEASLSASANKGTDLDTTETNSFSAGVSLSQTIFDGFKTPATVGKAKAQWESAESQYDQTSAQVRYELREAFVGLLKSNELIQMTERIAKRRQQNVSLVKLRYEAGREHAGSLLTAEADLAQATFEVEQAQRGNVLARQKLASLIGIDNDELQIKGDFDIPMDLNSKPKIRELVDQIPQVRQYSANVAISRWSVKSAYGDLYPSLSLSMSASLSDDHLWPEEKHASAGLNISLPLFSGGSRLAEIAKAKQGLEKAETDYKNNLENVRQELELYWKGLLDAAGQLSVQKQYLAAAQARAKIANAQYSTGLIGFDDWADIEDRLVSIQKTYLNAQAELMLSEAQWRQTKGEGMNHE